MGRKDDARHDMSKRKRAAPRKLSEDNGHSEEKKSKRGSTKPKVAKRGSSSNIKFSQKKLKDWFGKVEQSGISELARFVKGLREDEAAVQAAMEYAWSNGQVEGQINRLKMVKRQMFGRANLDLLKARVLKAA